MPDSNAIAVMGQLFLEGPTWDGNLISKSGRDMLVQLGLADRANGWQWLTAEGVGHALSVRTSDPKWAKKQAFR